MNKFVNVSVNDQPSVVLEDEQSFDRDGMESTHSIFYGCHDTPLGAVIVAVGGDAVYGVGFVDGDSRDDVLRRVTRSWPTAKLIADPCYTAAWVESMFTYITRGPSLIRLRVKGTPFQIAVWKGLLRIPKGEVWSYGQLASEIGRPESTRAVANAVAANPVAYWIPCHRVVRSDGALGGFRWGMGRKRSMLTHEGVRGETRPQWATI